MRTSIDEISTQEESHPSDREKVAFFTSLLLGWFEEEGRDLPWRRTRDPYKIWISEVILQQTRVVQGLEYYRRFIERYPDVRTLAQSGEEELLLMWQGLGYYSRAHNLHEAAKSIVSEYGGIFPRDPKEVRQLKGIGDYTCAAICSIAYDEPMAVLDGNVYRVMSRFNAEETPIDSTEGKKLFSQLADLYLDRNHPGLYNQAIMDLGAMVCIPTGARCLICPVNEQCPASFTELTERLPVKSRKVAVKEIYLDYILVECEESFSAERRDKGSIWKGLYQLPLLHSGSTPLTEEALEEKMEHQLGGKPTWATWESVQMTHLLTHRRLHIAIHAVRMDCDEPPSMKGYIQIPKDLHHQYAFPKPLREYLNKRYPEGNPAE